MNIKIYQINADRDNGSYSFTNYKNTTKRTGGNIRSDIYDCVFSGEVDCNGLEEVYEKFNFDLPETFTGRSLSVSDIIEVVETNAIEKGFYFCDSIGFKKIEFEPEKAEDHSSGKISVILVEPNKYPKTIKIEDSLEAMQKIVGGDIEEYTPFEDEVAIICNEEGKVNGMLPNRAIFAEPKITEMTYKEMKQRFWEAENKEEHITGYIVFSEDSFNQPYSEESRTYVISSDNKAFQSGMCGYSIYGSCLDGTDKCLRMDGLMADERGGKDGWKIEKCYIKENSNEIIDIIFGPFFIAYAPFESDTFQSLPENLLEKYKKKFKYPERFFKTKEKVCAEKVKTQEFDVTITETLKRTVTVEAENKEEAKQLVTDSWHRGEYILDAENFVDVDFDVKE